MTFYAGWFSAGVADDGSALSLSARGIGRRLCFHRGEEASVTIAKYDVSIVIPTYNAPDYCCEAIGSCLSKKNHSLEILVIDDGSVKRAKHRIEERFGEYCISLDEENGSRDQHIRYIYQDNKGAYRTRLHGAKLAKGEYLKFLDQDDVLYPGILDEEVETARKMCVDVLMTDWVEIWPGNQKDFPEIRHKAPEYNDPVLDFMKKGGVYTSAALYRANLFKEIEPVEGWRPKLSDDWVIFGQVLMEGASYGTLHRCSYEWRHHDRQLSKDTPVGHTREFYSFLSWMEDTLQRKNLLTPERGSALASYYTKNAILLGYCDTGWWRKIAKRATELEPSVSLSTGNPLVRILVKIFGLERGMLIYTGLRKRLRPFPFDEDER